MLRGGKKKFMKPKYWAIILLGTIATCVGVFNFVKQPTQDYGSIVINHKVSKPSPVINEVKDWKTYTNSEYGFEFKYPNDWIISRQPTLDSDGTVIIGFASSDIQKNPQFKEYGGDFNIFIYNNPSSLSIKDYFNDKPGLGPNLIGDASGGVKNIIVDGQNGLRLYGVTGESTSDVAIFPNFVNKKFIVIEDIYNPSLIDKILSSFRLIKPTTKVIDWKTYVNNEFGFSFDYPSNDILRFQETSEYLIFGVTNSDFEVWIWKPETSFDDYVKSQSLGTEIGCEKKIVAKKIGNVLGKEVFGCSGEGHSFSDTFYFNAKNLIWEIKLNPFIEKRASPQNYETSEPTETETQVYKKTLNSFELIK